MSLFLLFLNEYINFRFNFQNSKYWNMYYSYINRLSLGSSIICKSSKGPWDQKTLTSCLQRPEAIAICRLSSWVFASGSVGVFLSSYRSSHWGSSTKWGLTGLQTVWTAGVSGPPPPKKTFSLGKSYLVYL